MKALPPIAQRRLRATWQPSATTHPDSNMLASFLERNISRDDRNAVLLHLVSCAQCNRAVSLAAAVEDETLSVFRVARPRPSWRHLLSLARAVAVFSTVAVGGFVGWVALRSVPAPPVLSVRYVVPPTANRPAVPVARNAETASSHHRVPMETRPQSISVTQSQEQEGSFLPNAAFVTMESSLLPTAEKKLESDITSPAKSPAEPAVVQPLNVVCWRVSSLGALQRSGNCADNWTDVALPQSVFLHVVYSGGSALWVGGNAGALYRSTDAGQSWTRVEVVGLREDITALAFANPMRGWLSTGSGHTWSTHDGGLTWIQR